MSITKQYNKRYGGATTKVFETSGITRVMDGDMPLGERIRAEREARKLSQSDLARLVGISQAAIAKIESGETTKSKWLPEIMSLLNISAGSQPEAPEVEVASDLALQRQAMPLDIPVKGVAVGGNDADFSFNGSVSEYVRRPPGLAKANGVYAVYVTSDSMSPRFDPNDLLYVSALRPAAVGDYVVVELHPEEDGTPGKGFIKRLVRRGATAVKLHQFNPDCDIEIEAARIKSIHRVFTNNELFGT